MSLEPNSEWDGTWMFFELVNPDQAPAITNLGFRYSTPTGGPPPTYKVDIKEVKQ
jgi:hypothetical protein